MCSRHGFSGSSVSRDGGSMSLNWLLLIELLEHLNWSHRWKAVAVVSRKASKKLK